MAKITGIGGVFFKAKTDDKALREWYKKHLGIELEEWGGAGLHWTEDKAEDKVSRHGTSLSRPQNGSVQVNHPS